MKLAEFEKLRSELIQEGYRAYMNPIDMEVACEDLCEECGSPMTGRGLRKERDRSTYRAFAICTNDECGEVIEF